MTTLEHGSDVKQVPGNERHWRALCHGQALPRYMQTDHACGVEPWRTALTCIAIAKYCEHLSDTPTPVLFNFARTLSIQDWDMAANIASTPTAVSIFTTFFTPTALNDNLPPLTTFYVPSADCRDRWVMPDTIGDESGRFLVYSTGQNSYGVDTLIDLDFNKCQPQGHGGGYFTPGICPEDYTMVDAREWQYSTSGSLAKRWEAGCCRR